MNSIKEINRINQRELELGLSGKGSWHDEYKDSAYVFVGGLSYDLTEGDVITILSQWGEVVDINMPRDKVTGKAKGFAFVMFEDQRSTVLAVDNMNGAQVVGRTLRVDHCRKYNQPGEKNKDGDHVEPDAPTYNAMPPTIEDDSESDESEAEKDDLDDEDPMAAYLRAEKKKERAKLKGVKGDGEKKRKHKHDEETKEERRARKEVKRMKKEMKGMKKAEKGDRVERVERGSRDRDGDGSRVRDERSREGEERYRHKEGGGRRSVERDERSERVPTSERVEQDRRRERLPTLERDGRSGSARVDKPRDEERVRRYDSEDRRRDVDDRGGRDDRFAGHRRETEREDRPRGGEYDRDYRRERVHRDSDDGRDRTYRDDRYGRDGGDRRDGSARPRTDERGLRDYDDRRRDDGGRYGNGHGYGDRRSVDRR